MTIIRTQGDTAPPITYRFQSDDSPVDLSSVQDIRFIMEDNYESNIVESDLNGDVSIVDSALGKVEYSLSSADTEDSGQFYAEWEVTYSDGTIETFPSDDTIDIHIMEQLG